MRTHSVCLIPEPKEDPVGGPFRLISLLAKHLPKYGWKVTDNPEKADIVHGHALCNVERLSVYTNHGVYPVADGTPSWQRDFNKIMSRNFKIADRTTAVSKWTASQWDWWENVNPDIIYNFVDLEEWDKVPSGRFIVPKPFALWGKNAPYTGIGEALELAKRVRDYHFVFTVAPGELVKSENVTVTGTLPYNQMQYVLKDCSVYLSLSTVDNFPFQLIEAMALGKPTLAFATGGIPEAIRHKKEGYLIYNFDMDEVQKGFEYCVAHAEELGKNARKRVEELFCAEKVVPQYISVYESVLEERKQRRKLPKCSIVITTHNFDGYVKECIDSALAQDYHSFEVIVVDDGSTDGTWDIVKRYGKKIRTKRFDSSAGKIHGIVRSRNTGVEMAKGEFVCCLDGDDMIKPDFLSKLAPVLESDKSLGIVYPDFELFGTSQGVIRCSEFEYERLKRGNYIPCCNLFRKRAWDRVGGCKPVGESWEDYNVWLTMAERGWGAKHYREPLFLYRKKGEEGRDFASQPFVQRLRAVVNAYHPLILPPTVSVIIPCYAHEKYLKEAVDSVLNQTYQDFEIVVVNDGSPGDTKAVLKDYWDPRVRLIEQENKGLAAARNAGIEVAYGKYIFPLDADDKIHPDWLEKAVTEMEKRGGKAVIYSDFVAFWDSGEESLERLPDYNFQQLLQKDLMPCSILYPKAAWKKVGGYKTIMAMGYEDWEFAISLGEGGYFGVRIPEHLFYYRQHDGTSMRNRMEQKGLNKGAKALIEKLHESAYRSLTHKQFFDLSDSVEPLVAEPVRLKYVGKKDLPVTFRGAKGRQFQVSSRDPFVFVQPEDAEILLGTLFERA